MLVETKMKVQNRTKNASQIIPSRVEVLALCFERLDQKMCSTLLYN